MKSILLLLSLWIMVLASLYPGASQSLSTDTAPDQDIIWYAAQAPAEVGQLIEEGPLPANQDNNSLLIVDSAEREARTSLDVPSDSWIYLRLSPAADGELKLYSLYPTGSVDEILSASAKSGKSYRAVYHVELEGDYEVWYTLDGNRSNSVLFHVHEPVVSEETAGRGMAPPMAGSSTGSASSAIASYAMEAAPAMAAAPSPSIGFSAGGAKDINNFRENIMQGYLPLPSDVTYEGLYYDYYFDTGTAKECKKLFCPSYSYAVSKDPISGEPQHYLSVGLNSGLQDFQRKKLNLVVVLDFSGSMGSPFDQYYYDRFGNRVDQEVDESGNTKMQIADESVIGLLDHLKPDDRFGLVIFSDNAYLVDPLTQVGDKDLERLRSRILKIKETDGTNMEAGMEEGTALFDRFLQANKSEYENRIIFLTDAMPNLGETGDLGLFRMLEDNADHGIYTTFIGVGVDFNTELVENITKIKGANYYSVHSADEFKKRMDDEFDYMVTPLVFDLRLKLDAPGYRIEKVYGSPEADQATGELMKVNTLFPSAAQAGQVKGGIILVKLQKLSPDGHLKLKVSYEDRNGVQDADEADVVVLETKPDFYQDNGIRKAVLLSRYADLLKNWMIDERSAQAKARMIAPSITLANGIVIPVELGEWERQSMPLRISEPYRQLFQEFAKYFKDEAQSIGDQNLQQEQLILEKLSRSEGASQQSES